MQKYMNQIYKEQGSAPDVLLQIINELNRMEMNLSRMDKNTKGVKQLQRSTERIRSYLKSYDIEVVQMIGADYHAGMVADVEFEINEELPEGTSRIVMVNRPQVNFRGTMIQKAQITVAQNI